MPQVIPLPSAADYQFKIREKSDAIQRSAAQKKSENSVDLLANASILLPGSRIHMIQPPKPGLPLTDTKATTAKYVSGNLFEWEQDRASYSLSGLTKAVCQYLSGNVGTGVFAGPDYWALEGESVSLYNKAKSVATANIASLGGSS